MTSERQLVIYLYYSNKLNAKTKIPKSQHLHLRKSYLLLTHQLSAHVGWAARLTMDRSQALSIFPSCKATIHSGLHTIGRILHVCPAFMGRESITMGDFNSQGQKWLSTLAHIFHKPELSLRNTCRFKESSKSNCMPWKKDNRSGQYLIINATNLNIYFYFNIIEEFLPLKKKIQFIHCG